VEDAKRVDVESEGGADCDQVSYLQLQLQLEEEDQS
jgi:hypothetical protein